MGPNPSIHKLPADRKSLDLTDKNFSIIPIHFSKKNQLNVLILSKNQIRELPRGLKHLHTLIMTENGLEEFTQPMVECLLTCRALQMLDFSFNALRSFPEEWTQFEDLTTIGLFGNRLESFPCLKHKVETLDLGCNCLTQVPQLPEEITSLSIDGNRIEILNLVHNKLSKLTISMNMLKTISPESRFEELVVIDISRNNLTELPDLELLFPRLQHFDASYNMIEECPKFPKNTSEILFANNRLKSLPPNFANLSLLCRADFSGNEIELVPILPPVLQSLLLFDNKIKKIEKGQPKLRNLSGLFLNNNELTDIPRFGAAAIQNCWLMSNKLTAIRVATLSEKMVCLDVSDNDIQELPSVLFDLPHLMYIYAARNKIKEIPAVGQTNVMLMNLSGNPLQTFPEALPKCLESLWVADCGLKELPRCVLEAENLVDLNAARNELTDFPYIPGLLRLNLSGNQLGKFPRLARTVTHVDLSMNQIRKMLRKRRFPELLYLDISHNPLKKFSGTMVAPKLRVLKMCGCRAKQELDCAVFPSLAFVDMVRTMAHIVNPHSALKLILTSRSSQSGEQWQRVSLNESITYAGSLGIDNLVDDVVLLKRKPSAFYFGIFDSRAGGEASIALSKVAHEAIDIDVDVTEDSFNEIARRTVTAYREARLLDGAGFVLARQCDRSILATTVGGFQAFFVSKSLDRITFLTDKEKDTKHHFPNILGNQALDARSLGSTLVYNLETPCNVEASAIADDDKYLVFVSPTVLMALDEAQMLQICKGASDAAELAYSIRNRTHAAIITDNVTVIVVDVESERLEMYSPEKSDILEVAQESESKEEESQGEELPPDVPEREDPQCLSCSAKSPDNTDSEFTDGTQQADAPVDKDQMNSEDSEQAFLTPLPKPAAPVQSHSTDTESSSAASDSNDASDSNSGSDSNEASDSNDASDSSGGSDSNSASGSSDGSDSSGGGSASDSGDDERSSQSESSDNGSDPASDSKKSGGSSDSSN